MKIILLAILTFLLYPIGVNAQLQNNGNLRMHSGSSIGLFGDFSNNGNFTSNSGTLYAVGSNPQTFDGTNTISTSDFTINKTGNSLQLNNVLQVAGMLTFIKGSIQTDHVDFATEFVEFLDDATYAGESDTSHISGVIRKTGDDAFVFPTGNNSLLRPIAISAPALVTDHFTSYYEGNDPDDIYSSSSHSVDLNHISACEYWMLNRTGGNSNAVVTLSWNTNSCGVDDLCDLRVSRWDGAQWVSEGNGGANGSMVSGTLVSGTSCSAPESITSFSPFTLGSFTLNNPLPISLLSFDATVCESSVCLEWQTASEINNDFFTVEKSNDGLIWRDLVEIKGAGNSQTVLNYETIDRSPFKGVSYYRLKQTDFNGQFKHSTREVVYFKNPKDHALTIFPNPTRENLTIKGLLPGDKQLRIFNSLGQEVTSKVSIIQSSETYLQLNVSHLSPGIYHLKTNNNYGSIIKQ